MPSLLSGSLRNSSSPTGYALPTKVQYQLGPTPTTSTGYTLVATSGSLVSYVSSLGNLQFSSGTVYSNRPNQNIQLIGTGTSVVVVSGGTPNVSTNTGALQILGGIGIADGLYTGKDIHVNNLVIGQGYQGQNNIVFRGSATPQTNEGLNGQNSIAIGYNTLDRISTGINNIAIGRYALSTGNNISNTIAIGDSALAQVGTTLTQFISVITGVTSTNPVTVTVNNHGLTTGTQVLISGVSGTTDLNFFNNNYYYVQIIDTNTVSLYYDINVMSPVDGSTYASYTGGGQLFVPILVDSNIGIGTNAGTSFINGEQNFFIGHNIAKNFNTGSYNVFLGHDVANNMTRGSGNISIGGDNLVDGLDDQINIGAVFYYDGGGYLQLNADTGLGIGSTSTGTDNGALAVYGGVGISDNVNIGTSLYVSTTATTGGDVVIGGGLDVTNHSGHDVTLSPNGGSVIIEPTLGGTVQIYPTTSPGNMDNVVIGANSSTRQVGYFTDVYSNDGGAEEGTLLYTPRVLVGTSSVVTSITPRVGDFWIDSDANAEYQYIQDGADRFWLQIAII